MTGNLASDVCPTGYGLSSRLWLAMLTLAVVTLASSAAWAQSGIAGVVKDTSGAVLPGVTVEAASPALIEKVRTAVTDGQGRYSVVDLRPGVYTVTFSLPGFNTVKRDGIDLPSSFTATVNADLPVGALEETLTVSGQAPVVDTQSTATSKTLSKELLDGVPTGRLPQSYSILIPGTTGSASATASGLPNSFVQSSATFHGIDDSQVSFDGFETRHMTVTSTSQYAINQGSVQEVVVASGSAGAEQQNGGMVTNSIPKDGGNKMSGQLYGHYADKNFVGTNVTADQIANGITTQTVRKQWDFNPAFGGPIKKDRLWFFASYRYTGSEADGGIRYDTNPLDWVYTPDLSRDSGGQRIVQRNHSLKLTWQANAANKFSVYLDTVPTDWYNRLIDATHTPEASQWAPYRPQYLGQVVWKAPVSNRLLLEAGTSHQNDTLWMNRNDNELSCRCPVSPNLFAISAVDLNTSIVFRAPNTLGIFNTSPSWRSRASASYVTGSHTAKFGMELLSGNSHKDDHVNGDYTMSLRAGVPNSITIFGPTDWTDNIKADLGLYAQDRWTLSRVTLNYGLRYDYFNAYHPDQDVYESTFLPARHFNAVPSVITWHDLSPRLGVSYDVFGNGKTAIKATVNRYVAAAAVSGLLTGSNPVVTSVTSATRTFTDNGAGGGKAGDFIPQCNFSNPAANGECGVLSNLAFGANNPSATTFDPAVLHGYGKRGYNWETSASIQHELRPGLAVTAAYFRRWFGNITATDNLLVTPADYNPYSIKVPVDSRIPGGGGNTVTGYYDVSVAKRGLTQNYVTFADNFGEGRSQVYNGVDLTMAARWGSGAQLSGGVSTGRTENKSCQAIDSPQSLLFCDNKPPYQPNIKFLGVYPLPWDLRLSGSIQNLPGPEISSTTYVASNAEVVAGGLGRNLSAGATATVTLPILQAGSVYGDRYTRIDARFSKIIKIGTTRLTGSLDVFNLLNSNGATQLQTRFGPNYLYPVQSLGARLFRLSGQIDF